MHGMEANWDHIVRRAMMRAKVEDAQRMYRSFVSLVGRIKDRKVPNGPWYRAVTTNENNVLCYLCGKGVVLQTVLSADMVLHGTRI